ncbi:MAG: hypothetical protein EZS28_017461 [Streblomastix strix]|uniref:Uncharacterized protein n=1 Tax=Streblomastix strix TaxID=222440 RepID=A0A5J4VWK8_9EUKA|nr:MAG: hypothetical protein EZS28_017461 [Streblomastix strix]
MVTSGGDSINDELDDVPVIITHQHYQDVDYVMSVYELNGVVINSIQHYYFHMYLVKELEIYFMRWTISILIHKSSEEVQLTQITSFVVILGGDEIIYSVNKMMKEMVIEMMTIITIIIQKVIMKTDQIWLFLVQMNHFMKNIIIIVVIIVVMGSQEEEEEFKDYLY